tara:strand:+ start:514 stop:1236 length:723 start_codon:yes stop_codon:yes gene_type:complete
MIEPEHPDSLSQITQEEYVFEMKNESIAFEFEKNVKGPVYIHSNQGITYEEFLIQDNPDMRSSLFSHQQKLEQCTLPNGKEVGKWDMKNKRFLYITIVPNLSSYPHEDMKNIILENTKKKNLPAWFSLLEIVKCSVNSNNRKPNSKTISVKIHDFEDFFIRSNFFDMYQLRNKETDETKANNLYTINTDIVLEYMYKTKDEKEIDIHMLQEMVDAFIKFLINRVEITIMCNTKIVKIIET